MLTGEHAADPAGPDLSYPYVTPDAFETAAVQAGWNAQRWVDTAKRLRAKYLTVATFHCDLGYLKIWPSQIPGSPCTQRDYLQELIDATSAEGIRLLLYITRAADHAHHGGVQWLDRAAYCRYKADDSVDLTTSAGFLTYTLDVIEEVLATHPGIDGLWFDGYHDPEEAQTVFSHIHRLRSDLILVRNNFGMSPVADEDAMSLEDWGKVCDPAYDFAGATWVAPGDKEFAFKTKADWFYLGDGHPEWSTYALNYQHEPDNATIVRRILTIAGTSWNAHLGYGPKIGGDFPKSLESFTEHFDRFMSWAQESIYGTVGGGYGEGGFPPGWWNDGAHGVTTMVPDQSIHYLHVLSAPRSRHLVVPDRGYRVTGAWLLKSGRALSWKQSRGELTIALPFWDDVDLDGAIIIKVTTAEALNLVPAADITVLEGSTVSEHPAVHWFNGDYDSYFQSSDGPWPKSLTMRLGTPQNLSGLCVLQPETGPVRPGGYRSPPNERIREYQVHVSQNGVQWGNPVVHGELRNQRGLQVIRFDPVPAAYLRFSVLNNYGRTQTFKLIRVDLMVASSADENGGFSRD
jgi:alpha-L-fucosidase